MPDDLRERLVALRDKIEEDRSRDVQWYRSMTVLHLINDALNPPESTDTRAVPETPEPPQRARVRDTRAFPWKTGETQYVYPHTKRKKSKDDNG